MSGLSGFDVCLFFKGALEILIGFYVTKFYRGFFRIL